MLIVTYKNFSRNRFSETLVHGIMRKKITGCFATEKKN